MKKLSDFQLSTVNSRKTGGFTLLFASLMAGLLLAIGSGIFNIVFKEIILSAAARDSNFAFYSADTGAECALFWDLRGRVFATSSQSSPPSEGVICDEEDVAQSWTITSDSTSAKTVFDLDLSGENCAEVTVTKDGDSTIIESRGYNTCDTSDLRRVERGIRVTY